MDDAAIREMIHDYIRDNLTITVETENDNFPSPSISVRVSVHLCDAEIAHGYDLVSIPS